MASIDIKPELRLPALRKWVHDTIRPVATRQGTWQKVDHLLYYLDLAFFNLRPHKRPFVGITPGYANGEEYFFLPASLKEIRPYCCAAIRKKNQTDKASNERPNIREILPITRAAFP